MLAPDLGRAVFAARLPRLPGFGPDRRGCFYGGWLRQHGIHSIPMVFHDIPVASGPRPCPATRPLEKETANG